MTKTIIPFRISGALIRLSVSVQLVILAMNVPLLAQGGSPQIPPPTVEEELQLKDVFFDFTENEIRPDAESVLRENAETLKKNPNTTMRIEGYSDTRGVETYNIKLGQTRADAAKAYLVRLGIDPKRISTQTKGATTRFSSGTTEEAFQLNRRAHFILDWEPAATSKSPQALSEAEDKLRQPAAQASLTPEELSKTVEYELKKLAPTEIIFNPSREMQAGVSERLSVRISNTLMENLYATLRQKRIPQIEEINLGKPRLDLTGKNFYIKRLSGEGQSSVQQDVIGEDWEITPLKTGTQSLSLSAIVSMNGPNFGNESINYPLYVKPVKVKFNPAYSTINFIKNYWLWIVGIITVSGMLRWAVKR